MNAFAAKPVVNPWLLATIVSIATFMEVLDTTITNVSLTHIAGSLGADQDESTWILTSYLVSNGIILPLSGWLSDRMGQKKFFLLCIAGFTAASFMCGSATSLGMLIFFRLIQGLAGGGLQPTQQAIILDLFPPEKRGAVFGITGITLILAPIIGPTLGGWITDNFSWRWIFFINIPVGITLFMLITAMLPDSVHDKSGKKIDYIGMGLLALGLGSLQIVLDKGQEADWFSSPLILTLTIVSVVSLGGAVIWLLKATEPIVDLRLMKTSSFGISWVLIFFVGFALYGTTAILPLLLQSQFGYDATLAGLVLSPGGIVIVALMILSGRLINIMTVRNLVMFGYCLTAYGMYYTMNHIVPNMDYNGFVMVRIIQVMGIPFLFIPVSTAAFMDIPKEKNNKASALFALSRNLGGSFGIALVASYLTRQQQQAQAALVYHLTPLNSAYQNAMQKLTAFFTQQGGALAAPHLAFGRIYQMLLSQSSFIAYRNTFGLLTILMISGVALAWFLPRKIATGGGPAAGAH